MRPIRLAAAVLNQTPLDWEGNRTNIVGAIEEARAQGAALVCLPELCVTGYGCEDAFQSTGVQREAWEMLQELLPATRGMVVSLGIPLTYRNALFNVACLAVDGRVAGFAAKQNLAGDGIHYETRWFKPWQPGAVADAEMPDGSSYPLGDLLFEIGGIRIGFEICEDAWVAERPGTALSARAVDIILNPTASHFAFGKSEVRRRLVLEGSRAFGVSYVYANVLGNESGRAIYDGDGMVASAGQLLAATPRLSFADGIVRSATVDIDATRNIQARRVSYKPSFEPDGPEVVPVEFDWPAAELDVRAVSTGQAAQTDGGDARSSGVEGSAGVPPAADGSDSNGNSTTKSNSSSAKRNTTTQNSELRTQNYFSQNSELRTQNCFSDQTVTTLRAPWETYGHLKEEEFARAVALGLVDYLRKSRSNGFVLSLSGGVDSAACACLVSLAVRLGAAELGLKPFLERLAPNSSSPLASALASATTEREAIHALLLTAYQSTANSGPITRDAARAVADAVGAEHLELDVDALVRGYTTMISGALDRELTWKQDDVALQNVQARVRSPGIWMLANIRGALLLSTSNRSEAAVGYATMDGDTSGGLAPIAGIDKAYLRRWLVWLEKEGPLGIGPIPALSAVNVQAPSAELRPASASQTDEGDLMPYDVLDAIERAAIRDKHVPSDVLQIVRLQFPQHSADDLLIWVERFFRLFCRNQWKRERYAPSFHVDDENLDPKTWCRFPILSGGYERELREMRDAHESTRKSRDGKSKLPPPGSQLVQLSRKARSKS